MRLILITFYHIMRNWHERKHSRVDNTKLISKKAFVNNTRVFNFVHAKIKLCKKKFINIQQNMKITNVFFDATFLLYGNFLLARIIMINSDTDW